MPVPDGAVDGYIAWMLLLGSDISEGVDGERRNRIPQGGVEMRTSLVFIEVLYLLGIPVSVWLEKLQVNINLPRTSKTCALPFAPICARGKIRTNTQCRNSSGSERRMYLQAKYEMNRITTLGGTRTEGQRKQSFDSKMELASPKKELSLRAGHVSPRGSSIGWSWTLTPAPYLGLKWMPLGEPGSETHTFLIQTSPKLCPRHRAFRT